ncbi:microrchidia 6-like protein isoform X1 [Tanacetum coccineum]
MMIIGGELDNRGLSLPFFAKMEFNSAFRVPKPSQRMGSMNECVSIISKYSPSFNFSSNQDYLQLQPRWDIRPGNISSGIFLSLILSCVFYPFVEFDLLPWSRAFVRGADIDETFSPVVKPGTIRTVLSLAASRHWPIHQLDVKNAFLHGDLSEIVYMHHPPRFQDSVHPDYVCLLHRSLYRQGTNTAYLLLYVDDIVLTTSSESLLQQIIRSLHQEFAMTDLGSLNYFLGISVTRDSSRLFLSQKKYAIEILDRAHMANCNLNRTPIDTESKLGSDSDPVSDPTLYWSLAGSLQYLTFTLPDISHAVQQVCLYMHDPREPHFSALKRILRYVCRTLDYGLQLFLSSTTDLVAYSDADWAGCPTIRRSTFGYCVFLDNNLLSLSSKRQPTLSRSSAEAEYRGVANAVAETCWLRNLLRELHTPLSSATLVYCDNASAVYLSCNLVQHQRTKHIEIDIHFVRDLVAAGQVRVLHVPSCYQFADIFTKGKFCDQTEQRGLGEVCNRCSLNKIFWMNIPTSYGGSSYTNVDANAVKLEANLSQLKQPCTAANQGRWSNTPGPRQVSEENRSSSGTSVLDQEQSLADDANICSTSEVCAAPIVKQFWKAGVYNEITSRPKTQYGSSYLHIHPKFLHSNATSHKWVFGAVAELIDNAVDEIQNGATYVIIDKTIDPRFGSPALLIQDDGKGMDPEAMRRCLSFGFSDKSSVTTIGKYGNGFKTSSMRLGADVIVFSRNTTNRTMTQSVGLLSYTFLTRSGYDRIVVPMVHYEFNLYTGSFESLQAKHSGSNINLSLLLRWSPYSTEKELLKQFEDVGPHGTKIIVYNLWLDEDGNTELDFDSDPEDICVTRVESATKKDASTKKHLANRLRYSLRAYLSILYLKLPSSFAIVLRGEVIIYHNVATDLKYTEYIMYTPHKATAEGSVVTTIGVLEANFIQPTHEKQDFEKTSVFQKLVQRLKEMTGEYWDYHCGLIGYKHKIKPQTPTTTAGVSTFMYQHGPEQPSVPMRKPSATNKARTVPTKNVKAIFESVYLPKPGQPSFPQGSQQGSNLKRKSSDQPTMSGSEARVEVDSNKRSTLPGSANTPDASNVMEENRKLRIKCSEFEKEEEQFNLKMIELKTEIGAAEEEYARVLAELHKLEKVKGEASNPFCC